MAAMLSQPPCVKNPIKSWCHVIGHHCNDLLPVWHLAITQTNADLLSVEPLRTNFSAISIGIQTFLWRKMPLKMSSAKWQPFCSGLNVSVGSYEVEYHCMVQSCFWQIGNLCILDWVFGDVFNISVNIDSHFQCLLMKLVGLHFMVSSKPSSPVLMVIIYSWKWHWGHRLMYDIQII